MATETEIRNLIDQVIVQNGNNEITANVLRPILQALLDFTSNQDGQLDDLATDENTDLVVAINEVYNLITNPSDTSAPVVEVVSLVADYAINNALNKAVHEVQNQSGQPINILIPNDAGSATSLSNPQIGSYYDFFQNTAVTPVINLGDQVTLKVPEGDEAKFTGVTSGVRLLKVTTNQWRFIRLVKTKTTKNLFGEFNVMGVVGNTNRNALEAGDTVYMTNLNNNVLLVHGDYVSGDPMEYASYDPENSVPFDRDNILTE